jgi:hypothetical protein
VRFDPHPLFQRGEKGVETERHLGDQRKVHILARNRSTRGDEPLRDGP